MLEKLAHLLPLISTISVMVFFATCATVGGTRMHVHKKATRGGIDAEAFEKIDGICRDLVEKGNTPGIVLLIGRGNKTLLREAYGSRMTEPTPEPMTVDTIFDLASCTKATATASAIMFLVEDGRISLDDPVTKYVPEFARPGKDKITILSLLTHTSGQAPYTNATYLENHVGPRPNPNALIQRIAELELQAGVGEKYIYSCLNYLVLARVAQNVLGGNMSDFLKDRLWTPLGMNDTTFYLTDEQIKRAAPTIFENGVLRRGMVHDPLAYYSVCPEYAPGNAGCFSTVDDISRYVRMILNGGKWRMKRIFKPETWELITTNQAPVSIEDKHSCGWGVWRDEAYATELNKTPETAVLGHTGYTGILIWMDKLSKTYVIFCSNCVFPVDKKETKDAVIYGRREIIRTVLDHLDIYKDVRTPHKP